MSVATIHNDGGHQGIVGRLHDKRLAALVLIGVFALIGATLIAISADNVNGSWAMFIAGVASCHSAVTMIVGWGAASGHAQLAQYSHADHQQLYALLNGRVGDVEQIERAQFKVLSSLNDQVGQRRRRES